MSNHEKLDTGLSMALRAYEEAEDARDENDGISINLRFEGDLAAIEALGFETHSVSGDQALGVVRFKDIPALSEHPGVAWMAAGRPRKPALDTAAKDIRARASSAANASPSGDGLWHHPDSAAGPLTHVPDATGDGVIVAVIDTGIDYTHPMFMSRLTPQKETRILRIWDQGLVPGSMSECPDAALLASTHTYGVEYDDGDIEAALNGGTPLDHKDCEGHGTHVAGIASGGTLFPSGGDAHRVGVAPEASIIAVKLLDTPDTIRFRMPPNASAGAQVGHDVRFRDAVLYCLRTARDEIGKPVVINASFGTLEAPGDGLDEDAVWIDQRMDPAQASGPMNFPSGAVFVKAIGNDGDHMNERQTAHIKFTTAGQITVPLELKDERGGLQTSRLNCVDTVFKPPIGVTFWFRRPTPHTAVTFALRLPHQPGFSGPMGVGGNLDRGFIPRVGPPPSMAIVNASASVHSAFVRHEAPAQVTHPAGGTLRRHKVRFWVEPKQSGSTVSYHEGICEIRIDAPADTEVFAMCDRMPWARRKQVRFQIAAAMQDGTGLDPGIDVISTFSAVDTFGRHVITVSAYDETTSNHIAEFSSRGPLRDFSDPASPMGVIADKPDIAAPGVKIDSAQGVDTNGPARSLRSSDWQAGVRFMEASGTSMAAPMVAGVIALMLDKKPGLTTTEVRGLLTAAARGGVSPAPPSTDHANAYGSGMADALDSHVNTT